MKVAYFDCFSGISGDMCLGALLDAGIPLPVLKEELRSLHLDSDEIKEATVTRGGLRAKKIDVITGKDEPHRSFSDISEIITASDLPQDIKEKGLRIFGRLFEAEARVHGGKAEEIHLHELSGTDCIIDIIGTLVCLKKLKIEKVISSPLNIGGGMVTTEHGLLPVPTPATAELLKKAPLYSTGIRRELTTPTGAVIISGLAAEFRPFPEMKLEATGYGAGGYNLDEQPNLLRVFTGQMVETGGEELNGLTTERLLTIETNIDDMNPQAYGYVMKRLFAEGALDVYLLNTIMKKTRPGTILNVLCHPKERERLIGIILQETPTLGVRYHESERVCLEREIEKVETEFGMVHYKSVSTGEFKKSVPEYEDCLKIAEDTGIPLIEVMKRLNRSS